MTLTTAVRRVGQRIAAAFSRIAGTIRRWTAATSRAVRGAASRHRNRVADDIGYTRTVANAVTELVTTLLPQPTLATAVAILLTGWLSPDPAPRRRSHTAAVFEETEYDPYPVRRSSTAPPATGPLWDRLGT